MGGLTSRPAAPDTSYANFSVCVQAIQNNQVTRVQRTAIAAFLQLLHPVDRRDAEAVHNLANQYKSCLPLQYTTFTLTLLYFSLCESSLRQKFLNDAVLARDYATVAAIEKNPLF